jgi:hypothetical protein
MRVLFLLLLFAAAPVAAQTTLPSRAGSNRVQTVAEPSAALARALSERDVSALAALCADHVDLTIDGEAAVYTRAQVAYVLDTWLDAHPPRLVRFTRHTSTSPGTLMASGVLVHDESEVDLSVRYVRSGDRWEIRALHVAPQR